MWCCRNATISARARVRRCRAWCMADCAIWRTASSIWCGSRCEERDRLLKNAPHCVSPLPTLVPVADTFQGHAAGHCGLSRREDQAAAASGRCDPGRPDPLRHLVPAKPHYAQASLDRPQSAARNGARHHQRGDGRHPLLRCQVSHPERIGLEMVLDTEADTGTSPGARAFTYTEVAGGDGGALSVARPADRRAGLRSRRGSSSTRPAPGSIVSRTLSGRPQTDGGCRAPRARI